MRRAFRAVIVAAATVGPAVVVWDTIGWANPAHHDLSDAGTGLMQSLFAMLTALVGLTVSTVTTRRRGPD